MERCSWLPPNKDCTPSHDTPNRRFMPYVQPTCWDHRPSVSPLLSWTNDLKLGQIKTWTYPSQFTLSIPQRIRFLTKRHNSTKGVDDHQGHFAKPVQDDLPTRTAWSLSHSRCCNRSLSLIPNNNNRFTTTTAPNAPFQSPMQSPDDPCRCHEPLQRYRNLFCSSSTLPPDITRLQTPTKPRLEPSLRGTFCGLMAGHPATESFWCQIISPSWGASMGDWPSMACACRDSYD